MSIKRKGITKGDMVKALKDHDIAMQNMYRHILLIDDVLAKYIAMNKDEDKLAEFMHPPTEEEEKKNGEHKQSKRKRSRGNPSPSKK
jgi:hypothetical protein|tara:strand:- start:550 stop:810 length:261 start_codon:yes stop_codon:yes gene_type:complete